jgi:acyl-homoserine lactone acylase PvdQ
MTDIADKIYAATGLTLNAEAAAAIEQMIQQARRDALEEAAWECEGNFDSEMRSYGEYFAAAIRALGKKK